jgi:hypothetical protein
MKASKGGKENVTLRRNRNEKRRDYVGHIHRVDGSFYGILRLARIFLMAMDLLLARARRANQGTGEEIWL